MDDEASAVYSAAHALRTGTREAVREALLEARGRTLCLADAYAAALGEQPQAPYRPELNPPLWELGHVAWFQEWWIGRNRQRARGVRCDPEHARPPSVLQGADALYDSSRVAHRTRWALPLPGPAQTRAYLEAVLRQTLALLDELPAGASHDDLYFFRLVALHEEMHAEAAIYMAAGLGVPVPAQAWEQPFATLPPARPRLEVPAQTWQLGWAQDGFAFDNELQAHAVRLEGFEIDAQPVSVARFADFIDDGGLHRRQFWDEAGWAWLQHKGPGAPPQGAPDAPATHLSLHEAAAWCRWAGRRLPTEAEWECAAMTLPGFCWGTAWEWTASPFLPYPGFEAHPYSDYSQPWFATRQVLRGASLATSRSLAHPRYRNFFEPQRADILAGFRSCA